MKRKVQVSLFVLLFGMIAPALHGQIVLLNKLGSFVHADPEINAFDAGSERTFVTKAGGSELDVLNSAFGLDSTINVSSDVAGIGEINSVAAKNNIVAVAGKATVGTDPGFIAFYDATTLNFLGSVGVGANPDMVTFTPDGTRVLVANEGEPNNDYTVDPVGSVSIIDISGGVGSATTTTAGFGAFSAANIESSGGRIFGPGATVSQDLEPEYITVSSDGSTAYVSLQENNAFATVDIASGTITSVRGFGFKDHSLPGNGFDASNDDGIDGNIQNWPTLGMYQPDAVATMNIGGTNYLFSANEGDARDYDGFSEEERVRDLTLDPTAFPNAANLQMDENLGRLKTTTALGDTDNDGDFDEIYSYGARSFSIWDADTGNLVFDSGDAFEQILANNFSSEWVDGRSDDKGPEPESIVLGEVDGRILAFIGLERTGGIMIYDVTDPLNPEFESFAKGSLFGITSPEGLTFVSAADSPNGNAMLIVSNEFSDSGSTETIWFSFTSVPEPSFSLFGILGLAGMALRRRRG